MPRPPNPARREELEDALVGYVLEHGAIPWMPFLRDLALRSGLQEADASAAASLMASTVLGALLVLLGSGDKETATRAVYAAADYVEDLTARRSTPTIARDRYQ